VSILDNLLSKIESGQNAEAVLTKYSRERAPNAAAICDLAMYNYIEVSLILCEDFETNQGICQPNKTGQFYFS